MHRGRLWRELVGEEVVGGVMSGRGSSEGVVTCREKHKPDSIIPADD